MGPEWQGDDRKGLAGEVWSGQDKKGTERCGRAGVERRREEKNDADWQVWNRLDRMGLVGSGTAGKGYQNN